MNTTEHLLTILAEECAEVAQRASKAARFDLNDIDPEQNKTATWLLEKELADLMAVADMLGLRIREEDKNSKVVRVKKWMEYAQRVGTLR